MQGLGFRVWGLGVKGEGLGFRYKIMFHLGFEGLLNVLSLVVLRVADLGGTVTVTATDTDTATIKKIGVGLGNRVRG